MLDRIAAVGFQGLVLDRGAGYLGGAPNADEISAALGQQPTVSRAGDLLFWDLRPYARQLEARLGPEGVKELARQALADKSQANYGVT
jgi:hypothetical protein